MNVATCQPHFPTPLFSGAFTTTLLRNSQAPLKQKNYSSLSELSSFWIVSTWICTIIPVTSSAVGLTPFLCKKTRTFIITKKAIKYEMSNKKGLLLSPKDIFKMILVRYRFPVTFCDTSHVLFLFPMGCWPTFSREETIFTLFCRPQHAIFYYRY